MLLMSTHLDEAIYEAERLDGPGVIVIGDTGFRAVSRSTTD